MPTSAHPGHVNIPYSLGYRLLRICSDSDTLQIRLSELGEALKSWGYKERSIQEAFSRVKQISRSRALERVVREKEEQDRVRFVVRFDPRLPNFRDLLHRAWKILTEDAEMKKVFPAPPLVCYQRVQNIREMIVKAKLPTSSTRSSTRIKDSKNGFKPCMKPNCPVCDQLEIKGKLVKTVQCSSTGEEVEVKGKLTCSTTNLVYCITCRKGGPASQPIHSTSVRRASHWLSGSGGTRGRWYRRARKATAPVGIHFGQPGHSIHDLEIIPLEKIRQENSLLRKIRESFYIQKFNCVSKGLNKKK